MLKTMRCCVPAVLIVVIIGLHARAETKEQETVATTRPALQLPPAKRIQVITEDGIQICGDYTSPPRKREEKAPVVILLHMYRHDRSTYAPLVPYLHKAGFAVLALDMRGHGESIRPEEQNLVQRVEQRDSKLFNDMYRDVAAAHVWLIDQPGLDPSRVVLVGASVGCSVALDYAVRDRSVDGVVCLTPGTRYLGIDSTRHAKKYGQRPLLLMASEQERQAADLLGKLVAKATVQIVPGKAEDATALHGTRMFGQVPDVETTITRFLVEAVGKPATRPVVASMKSDVYHDSDSGTVRLIKKENLRFFSSAQEAADRGLRPPKNASGRK